MWVKTEGGRAERHSNGVRREKRGARWCQARQALITLVGPGGDHRRPERAHHHRSSKQASKQARSVKAAALPWLLIVLPPTDSWASRRRAHLFVLAVALTLVATRIMCRHDCTTQGLSRACGVPQCGLTGEGYHFFAMLPHP